MIQQFHSLGVYPRKMTLERELYALLTAALAMVRINGHRKCGVDIQ